MNKSLNGSYKTGWSPTSPTRDWADAWVLRLNAAGNNLVFSTYLSGTQGQVGEDLAISGGGEVFVYKDVLWISLVNNDPIACSPNIFCTQYMSFAS